MYWHNQVVQQASGLWRPKSVGTYFKHPELLHIIIQRPSEQVANEQQHILGDRTLSELGVGDYYKLAIRLDERFDSVAQG